MNRKKLETIIESKSYEFLNMIKESASDSVMMWINRNRVDIDLALAQRILDQYKAALENEALSKMDIFLKKLDKDLAEFSGTESETLTAKPEVKPRKNARKNA